VEITVVVTNYNYGKFLGRCLRSLLNQSIDRSRYEIIVVDDASTDDSREILNAHLPFVRSIYLEKNSGLAFASNTGIKAARSRYLVRVDADDYVHSDFLRTLLMGFEFFGKDFQAVALDYFNVLDSGEYSSYGDALEFPIACAIAFKVDALEQIGLYDSNLRLNEEIELRSRFLEEGFKIRHINLPLYRYVNHDSSLTRRALI
jgi:glycosyltransferase involved in cell wall biosynthesis